MKYALITGANKGIGFATARLLIEHGVHVYLGSRDLDAVNAAAEQLRHEGHTSCEAIHIDVTDPGSIASAREVIHRRSKVLDILVNNAGISGRRPQSALDANIDMFERVFDVNVYGVVRVTQAFIDLLRESDHPRIVNVSSSIGSLTLQSDPSWPYYWNKGAVYAASKAAQNMYTVALAYELRESSFRVNAVDPGYTDTDFTGHRGTTSVDVAGARIASIALMDDSSQTGTFISEEYDPTHGRIPW